MDLQDARESLAYWEDRAERLPALAVRKRREAREMVVRCQARVAEAERAAYGRGLLGAMLLLAAERRLPQPTMQAGRMLARRTAQAVTLLVVAVLAFALTGIVGAIELLAALL